MNADINLHNLDWEKAPASYTRGAEVDNVMTAYLDVESEDVPDWERAQAMVSISTEYHDIGKASLSVKAKGGWYSSESSADWGKLDELFGRKQWKEFLAHYAEDNPLDAKYFEFDDSETED